MGKVLGLDIGIASVGRRKKYRLQCIEDLLIERGFCPPDTINLNPYELRVKGLKEKLLQY